MQTGSIANDIAININININIQNDIALVYMIGTSVR